MCPRVSMRRIAVCTRRRGSDRRVSLEETRCGDRLDAVAYDLAESGEVRELASQNSHDACRVHVGRAVNGRVAQTTHPDHDSSHCRSHESRFAKSDVPAEGAGSRSHWSAMKCGGMGYCATLSASYAFRFADATSFTFIHQRRIRHAGAFARTFCRRFPPQSQPHDCKEADLSGQVLIAGVWLASFHAGGRRGTIPRAGQRRW